MEKRELAHYVDHTQLSQTAVWADIEKLCDEAIRFETASVCIPPSYVKQAKEYVGEKMAVCTVSGFPNGYNTTEVKEFETRQALEDGADEIDMVINLGWVKDGQYDLVEEEIRTLKKACGEKILKVIIETCLLTEEEKIRMCEVVTASGADFIKTSTGFSTGGATTEDVALMRSEVGTRLGVKASGGIRDKETAQRMIDAGASRLGTSATIAICS